MTLIPAPFREMALPGSFELRGDEGVHGTGAARFAEDVAADGGPLLAVTASGRIRLEVVDALPAADVVPAPCGVSPRGGAGADERHRLRIDEDGVVVQGTTPEAVHRGATSLRHLLRTEEPLGCREVVDGPRIAWRGLSLDVVRCFFRPDEVRQVVDLLSLYKANVLHLHLSDNEGWRLAIDGYPEVTALDEHWTQEELAALIAYAAERFVTVVPELDLPGHAAALLRAHPDWGVTGGQGVGKVAYLDPRCEPAATFVAEALRQVALLTPGPFLHVGGDESFGMADDLYARFVDRTLRQVDELGKRVVGWQEISRAGLRPEHVVQFWIDLPEGALDAAEVPEELVSVVEFFRQATGDLQRALDTGSKILLSRTGVAYFDQPYGERSAEPSQEADRDRLGLPFYPAKTLADLYGWDPATALEGVGESQLAGLEAAMWCETIVDLHDLQTMITARLPGFLEKAWSPAGVATWDEYRTRLAGHAPLWRARGWAFYASSLVDWA